MTHQELEILLQQLVDKTNARQPNVFLVWLSFVVGVIGGMTCAFWFFPYLLRFEKFLNNIMERRLSRIHSDRDTEIEKKSAKDN